MDTRYTLLALGWGALALLPMHARDLPRQLLPVYGGTGGTAFTRTCGADKVLTGLRYRSGLSVDAVGLLCRPVNADGTLGSETTVGTLVGGGGGLAGTQSCAPGTVLVLVTLHFGGLLDGISGLQCRNWAPATRSFGTSATLTGGIIGRGVAQRHATERCEANVQPMIGIRGRAGLVIDAIGFLCDEP